MKGKKKSDEEGRLVSPRLYILKITLLGSQPPIWRRLAVPGDTTLFLLHHIIQAAMGWENDHLHEFIINKVRYGDDEFDFGPEVISDRETLLQDVITRARKKFRYVYDFGDGWQHEILVEKITVPEAGQRYPYCLDGARACPPEDCGGIWGYEDLLAIINDPDHPDYKERLEWLGDNFDPEAFDLAAVNKELASFQ